MSAAALRLFARTPSVIGMVHLLPLPGAPMFRGSVSEIVDKACRETEVYLRNDVDSILVENMHDVPYIQSKYFQPETVATMTKVCTEVKRLVGDKIPLGLQILAGGNKEALAVAKATGFNYIRAEGFVFSHVADEGFTDANAGTLLRYRRLIEAGDVRIFTDVKKKHSSHSITKDVSLTETAQAAEFFLSDGIVLTGSATGDPADAQELNDLKRNIKIPIFIGSGVTADNLNDYLTADGFIIGSYFKTNGKWENGVDEERVKGFVGKLLTVTSRTRTPS